MFFVNISVCTFRTERLPFQKLSTVRFLLMNRQPRITITLRKSALKTKAHVEKGAGTDNSGRAQRNKKDPSGIRSGGREAAAPVLQTQLSHSYNVCLPLNLLKLQ